MIKINPPYKHLVQKPSCCGPTCLQMILFRQGHWFDQEELAYQIGAKIRKDYSEFFQKSFTTNDTGNAGIPLERFSEINHFLEQFNLQAQIFKISEIKDIKKLITENIQKNNDIIVNFSRLAYSPDKNWGHFTLINSVNDNQVELCDPSYNDKAYWKTSLTQLQEAMLPKWDGKERGIVIISKI